VQLLDLATGIDFGARGNLREFSPVGFSPVPDEHSTWSEQIQAEVTFRLPPLRNDLHFTLEAQPFIAAAAGINVQECWIYLNGFFLGFQKLREKVEMSFDIAREQLALRGNRLSFVMPNAAAPAALGIGNDIRRLGLAFTRLSARA
jgi:hypothetical protein